MSDDQPDRPPTAQFLAALEVKRNAIIGLVSGVCLAVVLFALFVAPVSTPRAAPIFYVGLASVVALTTAGMVAVILTVRSAITLSRELEESDEPRVES